MATWDITVDCDRLAPPDGGEPYALSALHTPRSCVAATLTTERAESSQGLPVVVHEGTAYGPADLGCHLIYVPDRGAADAARAAGYTVSPQIGEEPPDEECTDMGGWLTY